MSPKTNLDIVFGAMTFGKEGEEQVRTSSLQTCASILSTYQSHGGSEIDTSRFYGNGTSETHLAALNWDSLGFTLATKFYPNTAGLMGRPATHLTRDDMRAAISESLHALGDVEKVDLWYLHAPDRSVPLEETLAVVDELYREGKFNRWGVSNYMAWEVSAIWDIQCVASDD
ncbi:hypothetical protein GRF29_1g3521715 [Pseudopithomyces chartarum]|uniref:NADP-dependent oxidoreductase domain-containing protein n=1 Tax=Pseudopithomyces chartarum TaxID=1892770 RepID=A0AAN6M7I3_9PLEO|nr:hypothetical protein GRF29_1g3521715 [Pseudopithomyces chartarum]